MIYHYTNIQTLAQILEHRTIRFTRLDLVDDPEESQYSRKDIYPAKYVFVSCWTRNSVDTIPQWLLYGDKNHGVRIGLSEEAFDIYNYKNAKQYLTDPQSLCNKGFYLMPLLQGNPLYDIRYTDDLSDVENRIFTDSGRVDSKMLGRYKSKVWSFQNECRFIINIIPIKAWDKEGGQGYIDTSFPMNLTHYDIPISASVFENMDVMLGPGVTEAERLLVAALMHKYLNRQDYKESVFTGKLVK
jgi:hypothetical protein